MANCIIERPEPQALWDIVQTRFSTTVLGGAPVIPESNEFYAVALDYAMHEEFYAFSEQQWREKDPRTACCENLVKMAAQVGFYPKPAEFAQGYVRITGNAGALISGQTLRFQFGSQIYETISVTPDAMPDSGEFTLRVAAINPGVDGNVAITNGTLITPVAGVSSQATVFGGTFCGGAEAEECEQFRSRYLARLQYQPRFTTEWLRQEALKWPCVTDVVDLGPNCCEIDTEGNAVCPNRIEFYALFRNTFECGLAPQCVVDEMTDWLFGADQGKGLGQAEFGICGRIRTATAVYLNISIDGLSCATPSQVQAARERIEDFVSRLPPATNLTVEQIRFIILQIVGPEFYFDANITSAVEDQPGLLFSPCGDAVIDCDYKACLNSIDLANANVSLSGCV